jgi:hypothetical protein
MGQTLMPETKWERLDHRQPFERAEINRVGPGWNQYDLRTDRQDQSLNLPFESLPPAEPQPLPARPSDAELRQQLQIALDAQKIVEQTLSRAEAAHERAVHHVEKCQRRLAEYATLASELVEHKVTALKCDVGRLDVDLPDGLRRRIADRDLSRSDLQAAEDAAAFLTKELAQAASEAGDAAKAVAALSCAVLNSTAEGIAVHYFASLREAERCVKTLTAFDMYSTGRGGTLPGLVLEVLMGEPKDLRVPASALAGVSTDAWRRAGDTLKADPAAVLAMDDLLPAASPPPPPMTFALTATHSSPHAVRIGDLDQPASDPEAA